MNDNMCRRLFLVRSNFPDELDKDKNYQFKDKLFESDCDNNCKTDIDKIKAGCLFWFNELFGSSSSFRNHANSNMNVVAYIWAWLSYKLNQKPQNEINTLNDFYNMYIENSEKYKTSIEHVAEYNTYIELINKNKDLLNINFKDMSNFYKAFVLLCEMYNGLDSNNSDCSKYLVKANEFAKKYDDLNENYNNTKDSPYNKVLSTLSNDFNNFKNICKNAHSSNFPTLPTYPRRLVIKNTLISIAFIFASVSILLGVSYKYSLFGFRKRSQKQHLREKLKK
ncbi:PIR protein [Plasmodium yoelii]|uniref:PIR protein n=2 Tax=Plasmodium yoelii TaxID=5861 RepID=A0AAE9WQ90_PLAYO|nr:PIR protein [Plasmodium yoelii]WBY56484.1 PIR protein [Plasmodium yoelii yoelii]CDU17353.1 YIR protein [Plasmodium yoelii]VTZ76642.1 PIR protein [Plasmodium yoelii]|eukprot:XP_022811863.1 PIR protein [Plasmodium yoelii]